MKLRSINYFFLIFLVGVTDVKIYVKVAAIVFYLLYLLIGKKQLKEPFSGITTFYLSMVLLGGISSALYGAFGTGGYWLGFLYGAAQWLIAAAAFYLLYCTVSFIEREKLDVTIKAFFFSNMLVSLIQVVVLAVASKHVMPYWYDDAGLLYGTSTGDHIKGVFASQSLTNATVSALGIFYFVFQRQLKWTLACAFVLALCTSNITLILTLLTLFVVVVVAKGRTRLLAAIVIVFIAAGYSLLSPMNIHYTEKLTKRFSEKSQVEDNALAGQYFQSHKGRFSTAKVNDSTHRWLADLQQYFYIHKSDFFKLRVKDSVYDRYADNLAWMKRGSNNGKLAAIDAGTAKKALELWYDTPQGIIPLELYGKPGKLYSMKQTQYALQTSLGRCLFGYGTGNFSSQLAEKMTGLGLQGNYPGSYVYISRVFMEYHFYTTLYYLSKPLSEHSVVNFPDSVYNQMAGEYGLLGLLLFVLLYVGYFWKKRKQLTYGWYLVPLLLLFFGYGYWFEMVSLTVIFELLMLADIFKNKTENEQNTPRHSIDARI